MIRTTTLRGTLDCNTEFLEFAVEGRTRKAKDLRAASDIAGSAFECLQDCFALDLFHRDQRRNYERRIAQARTLKLFREALGQQLIAGTKQHRTFDDALQLANVSRPIVMQQPKHSVLSEASNFSAILFVEAAEKVFCDYWYVVDSVAQGRHFDLYRADAKVEVLT